MAEFFLAILLFLAAHAIPPLPPVRQRLIGVLGRRLYLFGYSLVSLGLLVWIIAAATRAPYIALWGSAPWQAIVPIVAMPLAFWLVIAGLAAPNPFSISLRRKDVDRPFAPIIAVTRHPVLWGFLIWAGSHIPSNGHLVALILFGGMAAFALAGMPLLDRRVRRRMGEREWQALAASTSVIPGAALLQGKCRLHLDGPFLFQIAAAILAYFWFLFQGHTALIGPDPLGWFPR